MQKRRSLNVGKYMGRRRLLLHQPLNYEFVEKTVEIALHDHDQLKFVFCYSKQIIEFKKIFFF